MGQPAYSYYENNTPPQVRAKAEQERRRRRAAYIPELSKCAGAGVHDYKACAYFINKYCQIYDANPQVKKWIPFILWLGQLGVLKLILNNRFCVILKARQLGLTWLVLCYILWLMMFHPTATVLIFSLRDIDAKYLLGKKRLKGIYARLPDWFMMRRFNADNSGAPEWIPCSTKFVKDDAHEWALANDSNCMAFPTSAGDSYTGTVVFVDEADLVPNLDDLMLSVQPIVDGGGQLILLSKSNKKLPMSLFKRIYKNAVRGLTEWVAIFLGWYERPSRTKEWYAKKLNDDKRNKGNVDETWENYPATAEQALAPSQGDKRISFELIEKVYVKHDPVEGDRLKEIKAPPINGLRIFSRPLPGRKYVGGADPAEGNPNSDDSALQIIDLLSGAQVAVLQGKFDVNIFTGHIETVCKYYNSAPALVERNNHGHAIIALALEHKKVRLLKHGDDKKYGYLSNPRTKVVLYDNLAMTVNTEDCTIFDEPTQDQVANIEGSTLLAPEGMFDDLADSYALGQFARRLVPVMMSGPVVANKREGLDTYKAR
jgi:hypothetical protein